MGCYYNLSGRIKVRSDVADQAVEDALAEARDSARPMSGCSIYNDGLGQTFVDVQVSDSMSYSTACGCDDAARDLAIKLAAEPAVLHSECDGEHTEIFVGPEGCDLNAAEITHIEGQIAELQKRVEELRLK